MSRVAHEFWNHKRIAQAEARQRLKALGILTGDDASVMDAVVQASRKAAPAFAKAIFSYKSPLMELLKKPSNLQRMYDEGAK